MAAELILVRAVQTCQVAPSQWDAWDLDGRYWYLRFRGGRGYMGRHALDERISFDYDDIEIGLEEFCKRIGVTWAPELDKLTEVEAVPHG